MADITLPADLSDKQGARHRLLQKGQQTKAAIIDCALGMAIQLGLEGLSIGAVA